jgi:putative colanic acid biosysnthesis UDP-glucose lipid carrier transferase
VSVQEQFAQMPAGDVLPVLHENFGFVVPLAEPRPQIRRAYRFWKRILDLAIALPMLVALAPLMLAIALAIRWDSKGPALFRQMRLGKDGRPFGILKFRTMTVIEDGADVVQAERGDKRVTRIGAFLRTSSLDELPQLLNVIAGRMSLVGPRPHATAHDEYYARLIPAYARRQSVKPGVTGWAQVNGYRGGTPTLDLMEGRVAHDLWYAEHGSVALDLWILIRTPVELLRRRNAY